MKKIFPDQYSISFVAALAIACLYTVEPVKAEGFPGIGDRVQYAEALPHYNLGNRYLNKQWYEKAVEKYRDAVEIYPYDADVYINMGLALRRLNDFQLAEWAYKRAIELRKDDWTALSNLANLYMMQDRFQESLDLFQKCLKLKDLPKEDKESILSNIDGIKKIMKNKGLLKVPARKKIAKKHGAKKSGKHVRKTAPKNQKKEQDAYESWLGN